MRLQLEIIYHASPEMSRSTSIYAGPPFRIVMAENLARLLSSEGIDHTCEQSLTVNRSCLNLCHVAYAIGVKSVKA